MKEPRVLMDKVLEVTQLVVLVHRMATRPEPRCSTNQSDERVGCSGLISVCRGWNSFPVSSPPFVCLVCADPNI